MNAGRLRHRVTLQRQVDREDTSGEVQRAWENIDRDVGADGKVAASIEPLSGREFVAAQQINAEVTTRIVIRWRPGIDPTVRVLHDEGLPGLPALVRIYDVVAALEDPIINRRWITLLCTLRHSEGFRSGV